MLDPQGKVVNQTLKNMGFKNITNVRQGKYFEIEIEETNKEKAKEWFARNEVNLEDEEATIKAVKFKGQEKLYVFLSENEDMANLLREILGEMI